MRRRSIILSIIVINMIVTAPATAFYIYQPNAAHTDKFRQWIRNPASRANWKLLLMIPNTFWANLTQPSWIQSTIDRLYPGLFYVYSTRVVPTEYNGSCKQ